MKHKLINIKNTLHSICLSVKVRLFYRLSITNKFYHSVKLIITYQYYKTFARPFLCRPVYCTIATDVFKIRNHVFK